MSADHLMMVPISIVVVRIAVMAVIAIMLVVSAAAIFVFSYDTTGSCQQ